MRAFGRSIWFWFLIIAWTSLGVCLDEIGMYCIGPMCLVVVALEALERRMISAAEAGDV